MEYWQRYDDITFETEEDAYQDYLENEDTDYLEDFLHECISYHSLLEWAMLHGGFWEHFESEIALARDEAFENLYCRWEDGEEIKVFPLLTNPNQQFLFNPSSGDLYED